MKTMFFSLTLFHSLIIDRKKFGPVGWSNIYDFSKEDLKVTCDQIFIMLEDHDKLELKVVNILTSLIN